MTTATAPSLVTAKSFLTRAEKQSGSIAQWGLIAAGAFGLFLAKDLILGFLNFGIEATSKGLVLGGLGLVAWMFWMWITNPQTHTELRHLNYRWCRAVSSYMMKADPFGRMKAFANEHLQEQWNKFNEAATRIQEQLTLVKSKIERDSKLRETSDAEASALKARYCVDGVWASAEHHNGYRLASLKVKQLTEALDKRHKSEQRLTVMIKILDRWRETFRYQIESTRMTAEHLEQQYNEARDTEGAINAASSAFGSGDMAQADKEVREYIEQLTAGHLARAEVMMKQIPELTALGDLKGDVAEDEMNRRLQNLDADSSAALVEVTADHRAITAGDSGSVVSLLQQKAEPVSVRRYLR